MIKHAFENTKMQICCYLQYFGAREVPKSGVALAGTPTWTPWDPKRSKWNPSCPKTTKGRPKSSKCYIYKLPINRPSGRYVLKNFGEVQKLERRPTNWAKSANLQL